MSIVGGFAFDIELFIDITVVRDDKYDETIREQDLISRFVISESVGCNLQYQTPIVSRSKQHQ